MNTTCNREAWRTLTGNVTGTEVVGDESGVSDGSSSTSGTFESFEGFFWSRANIIRLIRKGTASRRTQSKQTIIAN